MDDAAVEVAILELLAERAELYPSHLIGELHRRTPGLAPARVRPVLDRLFAERRVARLWHRYLLPEAVAGVRAHWLARLESRADRLASDRGDPHAVNPTRAALRSWNGW